MSKKVKVLFRHRSMEMGGVEKVLINIANNLNPDKFDVTILLNLNQGELRNEFSDHIRKVYLGEGKEKMSSNIFLRSFQLFKRKRALEKYGKNPEIIDTEVLKNKYDVEVAMDWRDFSSVLKSSNKNSAKLAWFHSEIDVPKFQPILPMVLESFPKFDQIIYCSQNIKDMMHHYHPALRYPSEDVIINAIPINEIRAKANETVQLTSDVPLFVSVGRLHTRKGFHKLMNAHANLLKKGLQHNILIIGDGEEMSNLRRQAVDLNVKDSFILAGNKMNPYPYIKKADFFIMPSESEAWPLVIAEALILKKPIIATKVGDVSYMIKNHITGHLIDYKMEEMEAAMEKFLAETEYVKEIKNNLEEIDKQFDNNKIFNAIENILLKLAQKY